MLQESLSRDSPILRLAVRECVRSLCAESKKTIEIVRTGNLKDSDVDFVRLIALSVLQNLFDSLKREISSKNNSSDCFSLLSFLINNSNEKLVDILDRYEVQFNFDLLKDSFSNNCKQCPAVYNLKNSWRQIKMFSKGLNENVPPLDRVEIEQCSSALTPHLNDKLSDSRRSSKLDGTKSSVIFDRKILSDKVSSSSGSSSTDRNYQSLKNGRKLVEQQTFSEKMVKNLNERENKLSIKQCVFKPKVIEKCDKQTNVDNDLFNAVFLQKWDKESFLTDLQNNFGKQASFPKVSIGVQTGHHSHLKSENNSSCCYDSPKIFESYSTATNSSLITSDFSVGQISEKKTENIFQNFLVFVNADGSIRQQSKNNSCLMPKIFSTPKKSFGVFHYNERAENSISIFKKSPNLAVAEPYELNGIPLGKNNNNCYSSKKSFGKRTEEINSLAQKSPFIQEFDDTIALNETSKSMAALVAREVSLLTSFDSSNTKIKRYEFEQYQEQVSTDILVGKLNKCKNGQYELEKEEPIEIIKNQRSSTSNTYVSSIKTLSSFSRQNFSSKHEDEEESTLNQISPLPTTG